MITFSKIYSQKIEKETGEIKITKEGYYFKDYLKSKKRKVSKSELFFDRSAKILERISYGRQHYNKLHVIGEIEQFYYNKDQLELSKKYISSCNSCSFNLYYSKFIYDEKGELLNEKRFRGEDDSLLGTTAYTYKPNYSETHFNASTYYQKKYNSENKITELNQVFEDTHKIRWQYLFEYKGNCRISNFQTYYGDGKENSEKETVCFDSQNRKISKEITKHNKTKILYKYSDNGLINKVEIYESDLEKENYRLLRLKKIKVNRMPKEVTQEAIEKINSELIGDSESISD